jgi:CTP synthase
VVEALKHAGFYHGVNVEIEWVDAEKLSAEMVEKKLSLCDGVLVPGGFGVRGIEGKIEAIRFARENKIPLLGICLGLQCAVIEFARNVLGLREANSREFDPNTPHPVIDLMPEQEKVKDMGGTMRLGAYPCRLKEGTKAKKAYGVDEVQERHRHRYEVNNDYRSQLEEKGLIGSGTSPDDKLVEIVEIVNHPWFVACQFHPEFKSRPNRPHPLFRDFIGAALKRKRGDI